MKAKKKGIKRTNAWYRSKDMREFFFPLFFLACVRSTSFFPMTCVSPSLKLELKLELNLELNLELKLCRSSN